MTLTLTFMYCFEIWGLLWLTCVFLVGHRKKTHDFSRYQTLSMLNNSHNKMFRDQLEITETCCFALKHWKFPTCLAPPVLYWYKQKQNNSHNKFIIQLIFFSNWQVKKKWINYCSFLKRLNGSFCDLKKSASK